MARGTRIGVRWVGRLLMATFIGLAMAGGSRAQEGEIRHYGRCEDCDSCEVGGTIIHCCTPNPLERWELCIVTDRACGEMGQQCPPRVD